MKINIKKLVVAEGFSGSHRKADWQFDAVRTCQDHDVSLVRLPSEKFAVQAYDTANVVRGNWDLISKSALEPVHRRSSSLEHYIRSRLDGCEGDGWIDRWPLTIVCKAAELLGLRHEFGADVRSTSATSEQLQLAGGTGFDILSAGPAALTTALKAFQSGCRDQASAHGKDLGAFYQWLQGHHAVAGVEPLRKVVRQYVADNYPVPPGGSVLGRVINHPRHLTLSSIEKAMNIRQERLAQIFLLSNGVPTNGVAAATSVTPNEVHRLRAYVDNMISYVEVSREFGCSVEHLCGFIDRGMINEIRERGVRVHLCRREVTAFFAPIDALPPSQGEPELIAIDKSFAVCRVTLFEAYRAFLAGDLPRCRRDPDRQGFGSLMIDKRELEELKLRFRERPNSGSTVASRLGVDRSTLDYLAGTGVLVRSAYTGRGSRSLWSFFEELSVERFEQEFISQGLLGRITGMRPRDLWRLLKKSGIRPLEMPPRVMRIFRRADLVELLPYGVPFTEKSESGQIGTWSAPQTDARRRDSVCLGSSEALGVPGQAGLRPQV